MTAEDRLTTLLLQASNDLQKLYDQIIDELTRATAKSVEAVNPDELYNIAKACTPSEQKRVQALLDTYTKALVALVKQGITRSVLLSSNTQQKALSAYTRMQGKAVDEWRTNTANAFIESRLKRAGGLSLSDRVWNYSQQTKAEFELAMSQVLEKGIARGISAESLGRKIRNLLKYPDMMYRRYHLKKLMSDGTKKDVVEWRRRVVDNQGKVRFIKEDLAKVGKGVYRSARQNALRLTITETNMAYNYANCKRWSDEPFVLGIRIRLSGNHPQEDICDELAGDYPKDFMWRGWHPRCRCTMSSILMDRDSEEWKKLRSMGTKEYNAYKSPNNVKKVPKKFEEWCEKHKEKLTKAREEKKLPYFVMDNEKLVGDIVGWKEEKQLKREAIFKAAKARHAARTSEKEEMLREYWAKKVAEGDARRRHEAIMDAAKKRHEARTTEQINDIQTRWDALVKKQQLAKKVAANVLKIAQGYKDIDVSKLQKYINERKVYNAETEAKEIAKKVAEIRRRKELYIGGNPFSEEEKVKLRDYEKNILERLMNGKDFGPSDNKEYFSYVLSLSERAYAKQASLYDVAERKRMEKVVERYLTRDEFNPHGIFQESIGGVYLGMDFKIDDYIGKMRGLTEDQLSIVKRFTAGSSFSNAYNLRKESPYWRDMLKKKIEDLSFSEIKELYNIAEEWSQAANYVLDKMVRYNGIVFRGLTDGGGPELRETLKKAFEKGEKWINNASSSTSVNFKVAEDFDGDTILIIHNKTGAFIHPISDYNAEFEVMTKRGAKYKVLSPPKKVGDRYYVEIEEVI